MQVIDTVTLTQRHKGEILALWNKEYPANLVYKDVNEFEAYLQTLKEAHHFLMVDREQAIMGWLVCFSRDGEKWFAMILSSEIQGKGLGSNLLSLVKRTETELNGWVIDHTVYKKSSGESYISPIGFYKKNHFDVMADTRMESDKISAVKIRWRR